MGDLVSVVIPSRNEQFLQKTVDCIFEKAKGDIEVIVICDGVPQELRDHDNLRVITFGKSKGLRLAVNAGVDVAKGKYIFKIDAHCQIDEGFDVKLKADCEKNWVVVPRRYRLNPDTWEPSTKRPKPIDYLYLHYQDDPPRMNGKEWEEKNSDPELRKVLIDDLITFQGSCYFMHRDYFYELELLDNDNYGTFSKEPQEISFKCWCSGGRVIRNKKTWYAHLHKGKRFGRGYYLSSYEFDKGQRFLNNWLTDSAWDKQTKPFRWMIEKFNMPRWSYKFEEPKKEKKMGPKLYQNLYVEGEEFNNHNEKRKGSKFWNEGKFENFIKPLIPFGDYTDQTFIEMGANAGLFLKMAKEMGFGRAIGYEKDRTPVAEGKRYRDLIGMDYELHKKSLGGQFGDPGSFKIDKVPLSDVTVMSTFHYYIDINSWMKYLDRLRWKTRLVIIVSRTTGFRHWRALSDYKYVKGYFKDWEQMNFIEPIEKKDDPQPRDLWSVSFQSELRRIPIDTIKTESKDDSMYIAMQDMAEKISHDDDIKYDETDYFKKWIDRKVKTKKWNEKFTRWFVANKFNMMMDIKKNGLRDPLLVRAGNRLADGGHRLAVLKAMGHKSVIVRDIP